MVTKKQALTEDHFHYTGNHSCRKKIGPKGGVKYYIQQVRRSGKTQTWKTRPEEFRVPVKYGFRESYEITESNAHLFHTEEECPLKREK